MSIVNLAPLFFDTVPTSTVVDRYTWGDPVDLLEGQNNELLSTPEPPVLDLSPARLWDFTQPALSATDPNQNIPGYGQGTAIANLPPSLNLITDQSVEIGGELSFLATASDANLPDDSLSFSLSGNLLPNSFINSATGEFSFTPNLLDTPPGEYSVTILVSDELGLTDSQLVNITISPATADIPCDPIRRQLSASCGQIKTHTLENVVDENGALITTGTMPLQFIIEDRSGNDIETGQAFMDEPGIFYFKTQSANEIPGSYRWAIREASTLSPVVYGDFGDYRVIDVAKAGPSVSNYNFCFTSVEPGSLVRITEDEPTINQAGLIFVADSIADENGIASFNLPIGTYWATAYHDGLKFSAKRFEIKLDE